MPATASRGGRLARLAAAPVAGLLPGVSLVYLSVLVVLPVAALVVTASGAGFWASVTSPQAAAALRLTVGASLLAAAVDAVTGLALAWVLVRDDFPGRRLVGAVVDLPFALPTIVAGLVLLSLYGPGSPVGVDLARTRASVLLALLFVTLPYVVRAVQPVLASLDRDVEDAAASLGATGATTLRRVVLPALAPALASGAGLAFARALGEFGALVLISGNLPFRTQVASVFVSDEVASGDTRAAAAVSVVLLVAALVVLAVLGALARRSRARRG